MDVKRLTGPLFIGLVVAALALMGSHPSAVAQTDPITVINSFTNDVNTGNLEGAASFFADDATFTDPEGHVTTGKDAIKNVFREQIRLHNQLKAVNIQVAGNNVTFTMQTISGTQTLEADAKAMIEGGVFRSLVLTGQRPLGAGTSPATKAATAAATAAATTEVTKTATLVPTPATQVATVAATANAIQTTGCGNLPNRAALGAALSKARAEANGGFNLNMWATIVNRDGIVCAVAFTGQKRGDQWPGSRVISAQKANTANAFSLDSSPLSTANIYSAVQPGGSLFGLQESNPVDTQVAYGGDPNNYGLQNDPMVGKRIGGINVFGGGLALYGSDKTVLGGLGVSGDSSCADHNIAWKTRFFLNLDNIPGGVNPPGNDNIIYDIAPDATGRLVSASGWGHPVCSPDATNIGKDLPNQFPIGPQP